MKPRILLALVSAAILWTQPASAGDIGEFLTDEQRIQAKAQIAGQIFTELLDHNCLLVPLETDPRCTPELVRDLADTAVDLADLVLRRVAEDED